MISTNPIARLGLILVKEEQGYSIEYIAIKSSLLQTRVHMQDLIALIQKDGKRVTQTQILEFADQNESDMQSFEVDYLTNARKDLRIIHGTSGKQLDDIRQELQSQGYTRLATLQVDGKEVFSDVCSGGYQART